MVKRSTCLLLIVQLARIAFATQDTVNPDLVNVKVVRNVDLSTHLPKIVSEITLENGGKSAIRSFLFTPDPVLASDLSFIGASLHPMGDDERKLEVVETTVAGQKDTKFFRISLTKNLEPGREITVDVETVYAHSLQPYPSHIAQSEKQFVKFTGNVYFYSPYKTQTLTTTVTCTTSTIDSYTKEKPVTHTDKTVSYGPYDNIDPYKEVAMVIHYENNSPFLTVTRMTRVIEVSHWGNIAVEETYDLIHSGAVLKGPFSRYDYQRSQDGISSVKSFKTVLPSSAKDVYYRDEIGNISTSHLREMDDGVELELRPRFPLFGGWKTQYYIGYNVPSYQYLFNSGDNYALSMKFVDHIFDDQVVDEITVKVILPEGASNLKLKSPYDIKREHDDLHFTYLDTIGRPVVTMSKKNLVEQHIQDFELHYTFPKLYLLQEPVLVVGAFFLLFISVIIYVRLDFSISKDEASESRMRMASLIEQAQAAHDRRSALYQSYEDAINKFKSSKDATTFKANQKKIDADHKQLTAQITGLQLKLKTEGADASEKVAELQRLDTHVKEQIGLAIGNVEKLISSRLSKQQYVEAEAAIRTKREDLCHKMDAILSSL